MSVTNLCMPTLSVPFSSLNLSWPGDSTNCMPKMWSEFLILSFLSWNLFCSSRMLFLHRFGQLFSRNNLSQCQWTVRAFKKAFERNFLIESLNKNVDRSFGRFKTIFPRDQVLFASVQWSNKKTLHLCGVESEISIQYTRWDSLISHGLANKPCRCFCFF